MKRFNFRLDRLLSFRKLLTNEEKSRLAREVGKLNIEEEQARKLKDIRSATVQVRISGLQEGMKAGEMINIHEHLLRIDESIGDTGKRIARALSDVENARLMLLERRKDEKVIESLRKRRYSKWLMDYYREDGKILDDIANIQYYRKLQSEK